MKLRHAEFLGTLMGASEKKGNVTGYIAAAPGRIGRPPAPGRFEAAPDAEDAPAADATAVLAVAFDSTAGRPLGLPFGFAPFILATYM